MNKKRLILLGMAIYIVLVIVATILAFTEPPREAGLGFTMLLLLGMPWNIVLILFGAMHLGDGVGTLLIWVVFTIPNILLFARSAANASITQSLERQL